MKKGYWDFGTTEGERFPAADIDYLLNEINESALYKIYKETRLADKLFVNEGTGSTALANYINRETTFSLDIKRKVVVFLPAKYVMYTTAYNNK